MFAHAPVTGTLLACSVLTTAVVSRQLEGQVMTAALLISTKLPLGATAATKAAVAERLAGLVPSLWQRLALEAFPCGLCSSLSLLDAACACGALSYLRVLERRWGSASTLAFSLLCSVVGVLEMECLGTLTASSTGTTVPGSLPALSATSPAVAVLPGGLIRLLSGSALIVPLTALFVRLASEVPPLHDADVLRRVPLPPVLDKLFSAGPRRRQRPAPVPRTHLILTKSAAVVLMLLLKLTLVPDTLFTLTPTTGASTASRRRARVLVDVGLATRVLLLLTGVVLGLWSSYASSYLRQFCLVPLRDHVCRPLVRLLRPLWQLAFGPTREVVHHSPPYLIAREEQAEAAQLWQRAGPGVMEAGGGGGAAAVVDGGRVTVQSLADDGGFRRRGGVGQRRPAAGAAAVGAAGDAPRGSSSAAAAQGTSANERDLFAVDEASVEQIRQLGLPVMETEIRAALAAAHGDVNNAVQFLLGSV